MVHIFIRDSFLGQIIYHASGRKLLKHPEEQPGYIIPEKYLRGAEGGSIESPGIASGTEDETKHQLKEESTTNLDDKASDHIIVTWDGYDDPEDPRNWTWPTKFAFMSMVGLLTVVIYFGSAIYTPGVPEIMETFGVGQIVATLPLSVYVLGYGIGPTVWSPLSEHPPIGKLHLYLATTLVFIILQAPTALSKNMNIGALIALRFITGFFASPALTTGGASVGDVLPMDKLPVGLAAWGSLAVCGPVLGPLVGGILVQYVDVFWTFWFMMIAGSAVLVILVLFMPESSQPTLLYFKAKRLRKITGNDNIVSEGEILIAQKTTSEIAFDTLLRPFQITFSEPMVLSINIFIALMYACFYIFFEMFPYVFGGVFHLSLVGQGLAYISVAVGTFIGCGLYMAIIWQQYTIPYNKGETIYPEVFIPTAILGACFMPPGMLITGWSATASAHWMGPVIGTAVFAIGAFIIFQTLCNYLAFSFPRYIASVFASNGFFRAAFASAFPLFITIMYRNTGSEKFPVGWGCTILTFATTAMIAIPVTLYKFGPQLRGRSKWAN